MRYFWLIYLSLNSWALGQTPSFEEVTVVQSTKINENSGIDLSYRYPDAFWTHNDSGGKPYLYLVSLKTGNTLAILKLKDSMNRDWEDLVTYQKDGKSYIAVADTGDNMRRRKSYQICILEEPGLVINDTGKDPKVTEIASNGWLDLRYMYDEGPKDCESIAIDLENNQFILVEKFYHRAVGLTGVFRVDIPKANKLDAKARRIANLREKNFSAVDISDDGRALLARAYHMGFLYRRPVGKTWDQVLSANKAWPIIFPMQLQGEGVCFTPDGESVLISSERKRQPIFKVALPPVRSAK